MGALMSAVAEFRTSRALSDWKADYFSNNFSHLVMTERKAFSLELTSFTL
jgi:hypothetical protein